MDSHLVKITDLIKDYAKIIDELREENHNLREKLAKQLLEKWSPVLNQSVDNEEDRLKNAVIIESEEKFCMNEEKDQNFWERQFDLRQENRILRQALSDIAANLGNGSTVSVDASLPFIKELPHEVKLVCDGLRKELARERKTCNNLREELKNPPADVQEKVLDMLGVNKRIIDLIERYNELRREVEFCLKGLPTAFGEILQKHDGHAN